MEKFSFAHLIQQQSHKYRDNAALYHRDNANEKWNELSWKAFAQETSTLAKAFFELGLKEQQCVAQFSQNKYENLVVDFALYSNRACMVPVYATSTEEQLDFIVNDAQIEIVFTGDQKQYDIALEVQKRSGVLKRIISFENSVNLSKEHHSMYFSDLMAIGIKSTKHHEVQLRQDDFSDEDLCCILYTSGTTGNPKGVMLPHSCFKEAMRTHSIRLNSINETDSSIAFLPLSHVFERTWCYFCLYKGAPIYINQFPTEVQKTIKDVRPTMMCAVPRFWEKVYAGVQENIAKFSPFKMGLVTWAIATGKRYNIDNLRTGKKPNMYERIKYNLADKLIFSKVKETLGIENARILPTAGARLSDEINVFFRSIGVPIVYGYGLTETTATVSFFPDENYEFGTVGSVMPDLEVKIGESNEILVKGKTVFAGYYNNPEATSAAFTPDGWFKTGDAGSLRNGVIILTERIKDLFKTSNGKYIAPQEIETRLGTDKYIEQVAVIGDERNYVTAIIAPSIPNLVEYAKKNNITYGNIEELLKEPQVLELILSRIAKLQNGMASYEQIKRISLIPKSFSIESGELTNTLKMRRAVIMQKYKLLIDEMYK